MKNIFIGTNKIKGKRTMKYNFIFFEKNTIGNIIKLIEKKNDPIFLAYECISCPVERYRIFGAEMSKTATTI